VSDGFRVRLLCEDRRAERFFRALCAHHDVLVLDVQVAPSGVGSAADWVRKRYAAAVRLRRSKNFQQNLGLLVHIDGDDQGCVARKAQLGAELATYKPREPEEPVALFVPTWCIETWVLHLTGIAQPPETAKLKRDPVARYRPALTFSRRTRASTSARQQKHSRLTGRCSRRSSMGASKHEEWESRSSTVGARAAGGCVRFAEESER
jgi:hypothetical protein